MQQRSREWEAHHVKKNSNGYFDRSDKTGTARKVLSLAQVGLSLFTLYKSLRKKS